MGTNFPDSIPRSIIMALRKVTGNTNVSMDDDTSWPEVETLLASLVAEVVDIRARVGEAKTLLDEIKTDYNTHVGSDTYHSTADTTNTISSSGMTAVSATASDASVL